MLSPTAAQDQIPRKLHQKWFVPTEFPGRCVIWLTWSDDTFQTVAEKTKTFFSRSCFQSEEIWVIADCQICQTAWRLTRKGWRLGNPCYIEYEIATIEGIWYSLYMAFSMIIGFFLFLFKTKLLACEICISKDWGENCFGFQNYPLGLFLL